MILCQRFGAGLVVVPTFSRRADAQTLVTTGLFYLPVYSPKYWNISSTQVYLSTYKDMLYYVMHSMEFVLTEVVILC